MKPLGDISDHRHRLGNPLTRIAAFEVGDTLSPLRQQDGGLTQKGAAFAGDERCPGAVSESALRGSDREIDIFLIALRHLRPNLAVIRVNSVEPFRRRWIAPFAIDKDLVFSHRNSPDSVSAPHLG